MVTRIALTVGTSIVAIALLSEGSVSSHLVVDASRGDVVGHCEVISSGIVSKGGRMENERELYIWQLTVLDL